MPAYSSLRYPKKTLMKASSFDVLRQMTSNEEIAAKGLDTFSSHDNTARPASSNNLALQSQRYLERESSLAFQIGDASGDDVFIDQPVPELGYGESTPKEYGSGAEDRSIESGKQSTKRDTSWALVPREPLQTDAQNIYPSSACVFVANLSQNFDDGKLEVEVTKYFSQFGTVFVKIRRDGRQMPFAFCQFTSDADAENAEKYGSGAMILGRPCRVEKATAHSCFVVYKLSGEDISRQEAYDLLSALGTIAKVYPLGSRSQKTEKLPPAMVVHYKRYDSLRSVVKTLEGHPVFCVDAYDPKTGTRQHNKRGDEQNFAQYEKDRRSAYFGNLPLTMTSDGLKSLASSCGKVICAELATKEVPQTGGKTITTCFGFVEFTRPDSVDNAIMSYHRKPIDKHVIKVERKRTRTINGFSYAANNAQRGYSVTIPSTWHGGRSGNRSSNANRIMNADVFKPPVSPISAQDFPTSTFEQQQDAMAPLNAVHIEAHQASQTSAKESLQPIATSTAASEEIPAILAEFLARSSSHGLDCQIPASGHGKVIESDRAAKSNNMKGVAMERESFTSGTMGKYSPEGLKPTSTIVLTPKKSEQYVDDGYQGKEKEPSFDRKHGHSVSEETKVKRDMETPTISPSCPDAKTPHEQGIEPTTSCFYPIIPPYPYSPYGFHPIPPFMANHITPQGGPALYNSFGHAYYSPAPYSDMYTMYPMMQHFPTPPLETPTRLRVSPQIIDKGQNESQRELYGMSPKSKDKDEAH
ncbi:hypothetical protein TGAMA5MH_07912 [Trichoderma gamsii]|uniref:RRM domain-containing protein n=1 Tax=Trichoderma gamsii TaxID=398673 RepID=A0A2K0T411_9HYPO|nr:hypothetical protein TGAMA5MH_07912 [Trichoderma gamsii]